MSKYWGKGLLKMIYFCKMIALFSILKQLGTVVMVKTWRLICCVENYNHYELILLSHFQNKTVCIRSLYQFTWDLHTMAEGVAEGWVVALGKIWILTFWHCLKRVFQPVYIPNNNAFCWNQVKRELEKLFFPRVWVREEWNF